MEKVFKIAKYGALPPKEKQKYEESLKSYNDLNNVLDTVIEEGFQKVVDIFEPQLEEERKQKEEALLTLKTTVINLQQVGFDSAKIAAVLGKTEEEITWLLA